MSDVDTRVLQELVHYSKHQTRLPPYVCFVSLLELGFQCGVVSPSLAAEITVGDTVRANLETPGLGIWTFVLPEQLGRRLLNLASPSTPALAGRPFFVRFLGLQPMLSRTLSHTPYFGPSPLPTVNDFTGIESTELIRCVMAYDQLFHDAQDVLEGLLVSSFCEFDREGLRDLVETGDAFVNAARATDLGLNVSAMSDALDYLRRTLVTTDPMRHPFSIPDLLSTRVPGAVSALFTNKLDEIR